MPAPIDISGQKFAKLTAIERCGPQGMWLWRCDCGVTKPISAPAIKKGLVVSCGCNKAAVARINGKKSNGDATRVDRSGVRYGMLTAISIASRNEHKKIVWRCLCDCGAEALVTANHLASGHTNSCGCARARRLTVRPESVRKGRVAQQAERRRVDCRYALKQRILSGVWSCLKAFKKNKSLESALGYSMADLKGRLMETMPDGYTWADFMSGALHIDHKTPLSAFNFETVDDLDFKRAWALSNLQLLPALDNIKKRAKLNQQFQPSLCF